MQGLPSLRNNLATWAVPVEQIPALTQVMLESLPPESHDMAFAGQELATTYFDTQNLDLRKNRLHQDKYLTLRVRCYQHQGDRAYALSAKTEEEKFHRQISGDEAERLWSGDNPLAQLSQLLPGHLVARLIDISHEEPLGPVVTIRCRRYAWEDDTTRLTLDLDIRTDTGKSLPYGVCEFKSITEDDRPPPALADIPIRPMKLSKFLWALDV